MAICPTAAAGRFTAFGRMAPIARRTAIASIRTSFCSIPTRGDFASTLRWSDALFGYRVHSPRADLSFDRRDSAPGVPKAVVSEDIFDWGDDRPPNVPWSQTVIYETHLRGLTVRPAGHPAE